jgi:hypothetical protein
MSKKYSKTNHKHIIAIIIAILFVIGTLWTIQTTDKLKASLNGANNFRIDTIDIPPAYQPHSDYGKSYTQPFDDPSSAPPKTYQLMEYYEIKNSSAPFESTK